MLSFTLSYKELLEFKDITIVLKFGLVRQVHLGPGRLKARTGLDLKKQEKEKSDVTRLTQSKTRLQPVDFCVFFT
jgi:hypothetical protein